LNDPRGTHSYRLALRALRELRIGAAGSGRSCSPPAAPSYYP